MSEFKGTKGKWHKVKINNYLGVISSEGVLIAELDYVCDKTNYLTPTPKATEYNSLLISKCPEMLEMLERMYSHWCEVGLTETAINNYMSEAKQLIKQATEL
jgi:hypothetical protein